MIAVVSCNLIERNKICKVEIVERERDHLKARAVVQGLRCVLGFGRLDMGGSGTWRAVSTQSLSKGKESAHTATCVKWQLKLAYRHVSKNAAFGVGCVCSCVSLDIMLMPKGNEKSASEYSPVAIQWDT